MKFKLLGDLQVQADGRSVVLGPPKQRLVLAVLPCRLGEIVPAAALADAIWGDARSPSSAVKLRTYLLGLRRALARTSSSGTAAAGTS